MRDAGESEETVTATLNLYTAVFNLFQSDGDVSADAINAACKLVVDKIEDEQLRKAFDASLGPIFSTAWMQYFIRHDPSPYLKRVKCPVLAINGMKDMQVLADLNLDAIELALTEGGYKNFKIVRFPNQNHFFQETDGSGSPGDYATIEQTLSPKTLSLISDWIVRTTSPLR